MQEESRVLYSLPDYVVAESVSSYPFSLSVVGGVCSNNQETEIKECNHLESLRQTLKRLGEIYITKLFMNFWTEIIMKYAR